MKSILFVVFIDIGIFIGCLIAAWQHSVLGIGIVIVIGSGFVIINKHFVQQSFKETMKQLEKND